MTSIIKRKPSKALTLSVVSNAGDPEHFHSCICINIFKRYVRTRNIKKKYLRYSFFIEMEHKILRRSTQLTYFYFIFSFNRVFRNNFCFFVTFFFNTYIYVSIIILISHSLHINLNLAFVLFKMFLLHNTTLGIRGILLPFFLFGRSASRVCALFCTDRTECRCDDSSTYSGHEYREKGAPVPRTLLHQSLSFRTSVLPPYPVFYILSF